MSKLDIKFFSVDTISIDVKKDTIIMVNNGKSVLDNIICCKPGDFISIMELKDEEIENEKR